MLSLQEFAEAKRISRRRARELIATGKVPSYRVGRTIVIPESALDWEPLPSRSLSATTAHALLSALSGAPPTGLSSVQKARIGKHIDELRSADDPALLLDLKTQRRAVVRRFFSMPGESKRAHHDPRLHLSGASHPQSNLSSIEEFDGYVSPEEVETVLSDHLLEEDVLGKFVLRVGKIPVGNALAWVAADLASHRGPRESREATRILKDLL